MARYKNYLKDYRFILISSLIIIMFILSIVVYIAEQNSPNTPIKNLTDALWWMIVTISTVGYGDIVPTSSVGRVIGSIVIIIGVAFFSVVTGSIASLFLERKLLERKGLASVKMKNHVVVIGPKEKIQNMITFLEKEKNLDVVIVSEDMEEENFENLRETLSQHNISFIRGDPTMEKVLRRANLEEASQVIILSSGSEEKDLLTVLAIRSVSPTIRILVETPTKEEVKHIYRAGADDVLVNEEVVPMFIGLYVKSPSLLHAIKNLLKEKKLILEKIPKFFVNRNFKDLLNYFLDEKGILILGIIKERKKLLLDEILTGDKAIDDFLKQKISEAEVNIFGEQKETSIIINPPKDYLIKENDAFLIGVK